MLVGLGAGYTSCGGVGYAGSLQGTLRVSAVEYHRGQATALERAMPCSSGGCRVRVTGYAESWCWRVRGLGYALYGTRVIIRCKRTEG